MSFQINHLSPFFILISVVLIVGFTPQNDIVVTLTPSDESELIVKGSSTLHGWDSEATEFSIDFRVDEEWLTGIENWSGESVEFLEVRVPVDELESGRGRMNRDIREALNAEEHPEVTFIWDEIQVKESSDPEKRMLIVEGSLNIAGETRSIEFEAMGERLDENRIKVEGSYSLNMEDYNVDPPTAFFGTLRADEMVEIEFDIVLEREIND